MGFFNRFGEYGDTSKQGRCKWCGRKLRAKYRKEYAPFVARWSKGDEHRPGTAMMPEFWPHVKVGEPRWGDYGDGHFCGLRCGYSFGVWFASNGKTLVVRR